MTNDRTTSIKSKIEAARSAGCDFTRAALDAIEETGVDPTDDLDALRCGRMTAADLLARCLDGADADRAEGWRDYVSALARCADVTFPDAEPDDELGHVVIPRTDVDGAPLDPDTYYLAEGIERARVAMREAGLESLPVLRGAAPDTIRTGTVLLAALPD